MDKRPLRQELDWGRIAPLSLRARAIAEGAYSGAHRSARKGSGVEFGGHRNYVPGDDLRRLDRHALMRHSRLMVREFETETERHVYLLLDATRSMGYRSETAPGAKLAFAALLAAGLSYVATRERDPVGLEWLGGAEESGGALPGFSPRASSDTFERVLSVLESAVARGDDASSAPAWEKALGHVGDRAPRGSVLVVLSDLLDVPTSAADELARVASRSRKVVLVRVLDPVEAEFPFDGPLRLLGSEDGRVVETDGSRARSGYLEALERVLTGFRTRLEPRGGAVVTVTTTEDPVLCLRRILAAIASSEPSGGAR
jgi:uncharacterized protein (DUF58 family)